MQRALTEDLLALRPALTSPSFADCKKIFREARVAAWHSRFAPPRTDRASWSQLIYAVCLNVLPKPPPTMQANPEPSSSNTDDRLVDAAFSIFSLYILHETNPLQQGRLKGLQNYPVAIKPELDDPNGRRYLRPYIRIDTATLAALLYWREQARAQGADDVGHVLERLWDQLDFCSYTGPRGLEALAGHVDYPYTQSLASNVASSVEPEVTDATAAQTEKAATATALTIVNDDNNDNQTTPGKDHATADSPLFNDDEQSTVHEKALSKSIEDYLACRQSIRLPNPLDERHKRKLDRIRAAIQPMFSEGSNSTQALITKVQEKPSATTTVLHSKPRMVTFSVVESVFAGSQHPSNGKDPSIAPSVHDTDVAAAEDLYELVLPLGTPAVLRQSLEKAVESMLMEAPPLMGLSTVDVLAQHDDVSTLAPSVLPETKRAGLSPSGREALQTLMDEAESTTAGSVYSRAGQQALQTLLNEAKQNRGTASVQSNVGQQALQNLLAQADAASTTDAATVVSHVGRDALQALLDQAPQNQGNHKTRATKRKAPPIRKGHAFLDWEEPVEAPVDDDLSDFSDDDEHNNKADELSVAVSSIGRKALKELMDTADKKRPVKRGKRRKRQSMAEDDEEEEERLSPGQDALKNLLNQADKPEV